MWHTFVLPFRGFGFLGGWVFCCCCILLVFALFVCLFFIAAFHAVIERSPFFIILLFSLPKKELIFFLAVENCTKWSLEELSQSLHIKQVVCGRSSPWLPCAPVEILRDACVPFTISYDFIAVLAYFGQIEIMVRRVNKTKIKHKVGEAKPCSSPEEGYKR